MLLSEVVDSGISIEGIVRTLWRDCRPYVEDLRRGGRLLYRGIKVDVEFLSRDVRTSRLPLHTVPRVHGALDDYFEGKFGVRARSASLFCYMDKETPTAYGEVYAVFPVGKYSVLYSGQVFDLFMQGGMLSDSLEGGVDKFTRLMDGLNYRMVGGIDRVEGSDNELMVLCSKYHGLRVGGDLLSDVIDVLLDLSVDDLEVF